MASLYDVEEKQKYKSKDTSVNLYRNPKVFNHINWSGLDINSKGKTHIKILNYGCGKTKATVPMYTSTGKKILVYDYDPNWRNGAVNYQSLYLLTEKKMDLVVCSNVLNVIAEDEIVQEIINLIQRSEAKYVFSVYEGNKTGIGKETKPGCWQRNQKIKEYLKYFSPEATLKKGFITNYKEIIF